MSVRKAGFWGYRKATDLVVPPGPGESKHETKIIPCPIVIGPYHFSLKWMGSEEGEREGQWGRCDFDTQTIWILETLTGVHFSTILFHEVFHSMHYCAGLDDSSTEESFTHAQAVSLITFIGNNPEVWEWLMAYVQEVQATQRAAETRARKSRSTPRRRITGNVIKIA